MREQTIEAWEAEIEANHTAFAENRSDYETEYGFEDTKEYFVVMREKAVTGVFNTMADAKEFGDRMYSRLERPYYSIEVVNNVTA